MKVSRCQATSLIRMKWVLRVSGAWTVEGQRCGVFIAQVFCNCTFCLCLGTIHGSARSAESRGSSGIAGVAQGDRKRPVRCNSIQPPPVSYPGRQGFRGALSRLCRESTSFQSVTGHACRQISLGKELSRRSLSTKGLGPGPFHSFTAPILDANGYFGYAIGMNQFRF